MLKRDRAYITAWKFELTEGSNSKPSRVAFLKRPNSSLYTTFALFGAVYVRTLISKYGLSCYSIYWIAYFIYVLIIYPAVLLYFKTRPKTYKVTAVGIIIDGRKIKWRNFKRISIEDDRIVLEKTFRDSLIIPAELKDDILKFAPRELVRTGLSHHRSARRSVIIPSNLS